MPTEPTRVKMDRDVSHSSSNSAVIYKSCFARLRVCLGFIITKMHYLYIYRCMNYDHRSLNTRMEDSLDKISFRFIGVGRCLKAVELLL